jgi:hypothetical protein
LFNVQAFHWLGTNLAEPEPNRQNSCTKNKNFIS